MKGDEEHRRDIEQSRAIRTALLRWIYTVTGASERELAETEAFAAESSFTEEEVAKAIQYLEGKYLIKAHWTMGGLPSVQLRHAGITEMERALVEPDRPTTHLAPINVVTVMGSMIGSQIQQASPGAQQHRNAGNELHEVRAFLKAAREVLDAPTFDPAFRGKAQADLDLIEAEAVAEKPNWKLLRTLGTTARTILEAGAVGVLSQALLGLSWPTSA